MPTGRATAYDLTAGVVVNMDEAIYMLSPVDTPMLTGLGSDGLAMIGQSPVDEIQFSWMTDTILTPRSAVAATLVTAGTELTVTSGDRIKFSTGDVITISKAGVVEQIRVTGYSSGADILNVSRAWAGVAQQFVTGSIVIGLGTALPEGSDPEAARTVDRVEFTGVTQIFGPTKVDMSRTEQQVRKYGVASEWAHQLQGRTKENAIAREQAFLYGARVNSTAGKIRTMGGLRFYITTNVDSTATTLIVTGANSITSLQQTGYNAGGFADIVMANPTAFADLNDAADTLVVRQTLDDPMRGRVRVSWVDTEFGSVLMARNRWCAPHDAFGISTENVTRRILQPLIYEKLAKTGDSDQGQIVCEEGLEVKGEQHLFRFNNLGYTGSN